VRHIVLLRGINLGARNRVAMPKLRELLEDAGFENVGTYVQSGNVVLSSDLTEKGLARKVKRVLADGFGLELEVVVRTRNELAGVVRRNPLGDVATNPKRYQVSFLSEKAAPAIVRELAALAAPSEQFAAHGRELYAWHPEGVARSKLWARLAGKDLGVVATARNWTTVTSLLALADEVKA
jgi:uncharacterized protein (DUF1697 family)